MFWNKKWQVKFFYRLVRYRFIKPIPVAVVPSVGLISKFKILTPPHSKKRLLKASIYQLNNNFLECTLSLQPYLLLSAVGSAGSLWRLQRLRLQEEWAREYSIVCTQAAFSLCKTRYWGHEKQLGCRHRRPLLPNQNSTFSHSSTLNCRKSRIILNYSSSAKLV